MTIRIGHEFKPTFEIFDCEQGSPDWYKLRMGISTASEFSTVLAEGRSGGESKTRRTYLHKLVGERISDEPMENHVSRAMERGKQLEPEARLYYELLTDHKLERVGFIKNGRSGCSPDALIGNGGGLEIKVVLAHTLVAAHADKKNPIPTEHIPQVQGNIWISMREWWDLLIYCPKMPAFLKRVYRDEKYIKETLEPGVRQFNDELDELTERIKALQ